MIANLTKHKKIEIEVIKADSFWQKTKGLIKKENIAIFFKTRFGIHTFLMQYPIDIYILNRQNRVVKIKKSLKPNQVFLWNPFYQIVLEIPSDLVKKEDIEIGNKLKISF